MWNFAKFGEISHFSTGQMWRNLKFIQFFVIKSVLLCFCEIRFGVIYALLRGEKFSKKMGRWRKNDKYHVWASGHSPVTVTYLPRLGWRGIDKAPQKPQQAFELEFQVKPLQLASNANGVAQELLLVGIKSISILISSNPSPCNLSCYLSIRFYFLFSQRFVSGWIQGSLRGAAHPNQWNSFVLWLTKGWVPRVAKSDLNSTDAYFGTKNWHQKMAQKLPKITQSSPKMTLKGGVWQTLARGNLKRSLRWPWKS